MVDNSKENPSQRLGRYTTRFRRKLPLPRAWHLRMDLHRIDKLYAPLVANAMGQEREQLDSAWAFEMKREPACHARELYPQYQG